MAGLEYQAKFKAQHGEVRKVASALIDAAKAQLAKDGRFLPHGALVDGEGRVRVASAAPIEGEELSPEEMLEDMESAMAEASEQAGCVATAVAEQLRTAPGGGPETEAIRIRYRANDGFALDLVQPIADTKDGWEFGEIITMPVAAG